MRFTLDALPDHSWPAVAFGDPWNGWATPVVTREVLADVLLTSGEPHRWKDEIAMLGTPSGDMRPGVEPEFFDPVRPREDGLFDLGQMGWVFVRVDESEAPETQEVAAVALAALLSHEAVATRVDERLLEALLAHALNVVPGLASRLHLPSDARFALGARGDEPDVIGRVSGDAACGIEVKVHSNLNWAERSGAWQLDNYAARFPVGSRLLLLTSDARASRLADELERQEVLSRDRWECLSLGSLAAALTEVAPVAHSQPGVTNLMLALARLTTA